MVVSLLYYTQCASHFLNVTNAEFQEWLSFSHCIYLPEKLGFRKGRACRKSRVGSEKLREKNQVFGPPAVLQECPAEIKIYCGEICGR